MSEKVFVKDNPAKRVILAGGIVSLVMIVLYLLSAGRGTPQAVSDTVHAERIMRNALDCISGYCTSNGININRHDDPSGSGLIGPELSGITTSLGQLEAKRTTLDPAFASLVEKMLGEAGVEQGDTVAVGCSGSFPGLLLATLSATKAMKVYPVVIISVGSSSFGASNPCFTLPDIYNLLLSEGIFTVPPAAVSLGGDYDNGTGFDDGMVEEMEKKIRESGYIFIKDDNLVSNVGAREKIYFGGNNNRVAAFINIGGAYANMGTDPLILGLHPGINTEGKIPVVNKRGVLYSMMARGIPVIHLLNIKGLVQKYNMEWDPVSPGHKGSIVTGNVNGSLSVVLPVCGVLFFIFLLLVVSKLNNINHFRG